MSRHADDLAHLRTVLDSKTALEVTSFYDHLLRNGHDYAAVSRLFMTAEYSRSGSGADPDAAHLLALHRRYTTLGTAGASDEDCCEHRGASLCSPHCAACELTLHS